MRNHARAAAAPTYTPEPAGDYLPDYLSVALPRPAAACYALFCDVERTPEWLSVIRSAVVTESDGRGRARRVAYQVGLKRASIGYSCVYGYHESERRVSWSTSERSSILVRGFAQFQSLADRSCLMSYGLEVDLGSLGLPAFDDAQYDAHAASASLSDFRDFAIRSLD